MGETAAATAPSSSTTADHGTDTSAEPAGHQTDTTASSTSTPTAERTADDLGPNTASSGLDADGVEDAGPGPDPDEAPASSERDNADSDQVGSAHESLDSADPESAGSTLHNAADQDETPTGQDETSTGQATAATEEESTAPATNAPTVHKLRTEPMSLEQALEAAGRLAPEIVLPTDCRPPPLSAPSSLPNAPRAYRAGIHQGIDIGCPTLGHPVVAALGGRVVVAVGDFRDPSSREWNLMLDTAQALGATPPYTLVMLYGRYVVVDHGIVEDVGHVVTLYAHLNSVDPGIRPGMWVDAGQSLGGIGNSGTRSGAAGSSSGQLHLHWELHIDGQYLGTGLSPADTRAVYTAVFKDASG